MLGDRDLGAVLHAGQVPAEVVLQVPYADLNPLWAQFLDGRLSAEALAEQTQALTDKVRTDPEVEHYTVS